MYKAPGSIWEHTVPGTQSKRSDKRATKKKAEKREHECAVHALKTSRYYSCRTLLYEHPHDAY